jgi:hypothetical protein
VDGLQTYDKYGNTPDAITTAVIDNKALEDAKFGLDLSCKKTGPGADTLDIKALMVAKTPLVNQNIVMHITVLERAITQGNGGGNALNNGYEWVLRKMLPDASGTLISQNWNTGDSLVIPQKWQFAAGDFFDTSKIEIVAFVQNYQTKEVYQAARIGANGSTTTIPIVTDVTPDADATNSLLVYPVPSDDQINILFANDTKEEADYSLMNELGITVASGKISKGIRMLTFNSKQYASGVYHLSIVKEDGSRIVRKIMVMH